MEWLLTFVGTSDCREERFGLIGGLSRSVQVDGVYHQDILKIDIL